MSRNFPGSCSVRPLAAIALWLTLLAGAVGEASHGTLQGGVAIEFVEMTSDQISGAGGGEGCLVTGAVRNGSGRTVTVRVLYQGYDASGARVAQAWARVREVGPGEHRLFTSSHFVDGSGSGRTYACSTLRRVDMVEAVAEPGS